MLTVLTTNAYIHTHTHTQKHKEIFGGDRYVQYIVVMVSQDVRICPDSSRYIY